MSLSTDDKIKYGLRIWGALIALFGVGVLVYNLVKG